jgi:UDP-GlcNAc3NAcA epimerase
MLKIVTIIGARPQIIKAAALSRAIRNHFKDKIKEIIVQTGQHYDRNMSQDFIEELGIPASNYNLQIGSTTHGKQTGRMIERIEEVLLEEHPDFVVVYGDTNSTLAGSIAASKVQIPIVHIEAGLRSNNKRMPEEINRILCDHTSTLLFTPTKTGLYNLIREGFNPDNKLPFSADNPGVFLCGDVMYDNNLYFKHIAEKKSNILKDLNIENEKYYLATVHRDNNTDDPNRLNEIFSAFNNISQHYKTTIVLPLHPRTSKAIETNLNKALVKELDSNRFIKIIQPTSFLDMLMLQSKTTMVFTDSGGLQKEAYFSEKPVIILRSETEWKEIESTETGIVADANESKIIHAHDYFHELKQKPRFPSIFGDGHAAEFICQKLLTQ